MESQEFYKSLAFADEPMLYLKFDQALEFLSAVRTMRERLIIRYFLLNGLSPMELSRACVEHLDPCSNTLFLPKRHWKKNCTTDIDAETIRLQILYSGDHREGPLIRSRTGAHVTPCSLWKIVKLVAARTAIPGWENISPIILKRTFAREWLLSGGNLGSLQKQFSHRHLSATAHYLRFIMEDVKYNHHRLAAHLQGAGER